jgi:uncharacterized lipoprotein
MHNNKKSIGKCGPCPIFASYTLAFALQLRKKHRQTSVRVAARTTQAQYNTRTMNSTIHRRKTVRQSSTMSQNNKEHRTQKRKQLQVSKQVDKIPKDVLILRLVKRAMILA